MDHADFMGSLPAKTKASLTKKSDAKGILHLIAHMGLIAVCGTMIALRVPLWWALLPVQGVLIVFLFTLEHECTHQTPFKTPRLNEWVGHACGFLLLLPFTWFRYFHLAHHRYTNIPDKDPELSSPKPETWRAYIWHVTGVPYWLSMARVVVENALDRAGADYLPPRAKGRIKVEARVMLVGYLGVGLSLIWSPVLIWIWLVPILLGQPFLRLYLLAEHGRCAFVANMFENTRTTYTGALIRFLAWNMPYHVEHHTFPNVPFHKLPEFHGMIEEHLKVTANGYAAFTKEYAGHLE